MQQLSLSHHRAAMGNIKPWLPGRRRAPSPHPLGRKGGWLSNTKSPLSPPLPSALGGPALQQGGGRGGPASGSSPSWSGPGAPAGGRGLPHSAKGAGTRGCRAGEAGGSRQFRWTAPKPRGTGGRGYANGRGKETAQRKRGGGGVSHRAAVALISGGNANFVFSKNGFWSVLPKALP